MGRKTHGDDIKGASMGNAGKHGSEAPTNHELSEAIKRIDGGAEAYEVSGDGASAAFAKLRPDLVRR